MYHFCVSVYFFLSLEIREIVFFSYPFPSASLFLGFYLMTDDLECVHADALVC